MAWVITYPTDTTWQAVNTLPDGVSDLSVSADTGETAGLTVSIGDTTAPTVTVFTIPATSSSLTVPITTLSATDDTAVTGYLVTESAVTPNASDPGWTATAPTNYTFASAGSKTLYAWAKDAAGNVSAGVSAGVVISLAVAGSATIIGVSVTTSVATIISSVAVVPGVSQFKAPDGTPITFLTIYGEPITFNF